MFSLVDVPDLLVLADLWPTMETIWMGAGPVPEILHRALAALAWLVRIGLLPSVLPLAPLIYFVMNHLRWGEHRGGMFVKIKGVDANGILCERSWHLLAEGNEGPFIPSMAVQALIRKILAGQPPASGARACLRDVELEEYEALFSSRAIYTGFREEYPQACLYRKMLGSAWEALPAEIIAMHATTLTAAGRAVVERGDGFLAKLVARIIGFPKATLDTPVTVQFEANEGGETWTRTFGADSFLSRQFAGRGRSSQLVCERFGPLTFAIALVWDQGRLSLILRRWSACGVPLPLWLGPRTTSYESVEDGTFRFHVEIAHPLAGLIVRYHGWLAPMSVAS